mgnify:CR=1 FL=1
MARDLIELRPSPCQELAGEDAGAGSPGRYAPSFVPPAPADFMRAPRGQSARRKVVRETIQREIIEDQAESHAEDLGRAPWLQVVLALCATFVVFLICSALVSVFGSPGAGTAFIVLIALASAGGGMLVLKGLQLVRGR